MKLFFESRAFVLVQVQLGKSESHRTTGSAFARSDLRATFGPTLESISAQQASNMTRNVHALNCA